MSFPSRFPRLVIFKALRGGAWIFAILLCFLLINSANAQAQSSPLSLEIASPGEGETFYAGPSSLMYSMKVKGYLTSAQADFDLQQVDLKLEVWQGEQLVDEVHTRSDPVGYFTYSLAVNPDGSTAIFPPEYQPFCETCHIASDHALRAGQVRLRVVASAPSGASATAERRIIVDRSTMTSLQVRVVLADDPQQGVANIPVRASARLYQWRGRSFLGTSNVEGLAVIPLERLSEAPTHYIARVDPVVVDGKRYASTGSVEVVLEPDFGESPQLTLQLTAEYGSIYAQVSDAQGRLIDGLPLKLVHLPDGNILQNLVSRQGTCHVENMPIERYLLLAGGPAASGGEWASGILPVDLTENIHASVSLVMSAAETGMQGTLTGVDQNPLPFAWVQAEKNQLVQAVDPASGSFYLTGLQIEKDTLLLSAPGYYSTAVVDVVGKSQTPIELKLRPDTQSFSWGQGALLVPSESVIESEPSRLLLRRGWLFGAGTGSLPVTLAADDLQIRVKDGRFALEYLPGESSWFFLFSGQASITQLGKPASLTLEGGQMLRFDVDDTLQPANYDSQVIAALRDLNRQEISLAWEPTASARLRNELARLGIGMIQAVTYLAYLGILMAVLVVPLLYMLRLRKQKQQDKSQPISESQEVK
jgi:hypothetical protein